MRLSEIFCSLYSTLLFEFQLTNYIRYHKPTFKRGRSGRSISEALDGSRWSSLASSDISKPGDEVPGAAHDPTLTSLAQLGCYLLDCERSFISILDNDAQYAIAEASRNLSLNDEIKPEPGLKAPTEASVVDLNWDVSLQALRAFTAIDDRQNVSNEHVIINQDVHVMNNMPLVEGLRERPFIPEVPT